jgi:uncharacterized protein YndB with AHSA1/START domain
MTTETGHAATVRLTRMYAAPAHALYRAWLDPATLSRWMAPGSFTMASVEVDERVGGRFAVRHALDGVVAGGFECQIVALDPDRRLVFRWGFCGPEGGDGPVFDSVLTVTLEPAGPDQTRLTLVHEHLEALYAGRPDAAGKVEVGWADVLAQLDGLVGPAAP